VTEAVSAGVAPTLISTGSGEADTRGSDPVLAAGTTVGEYTIEGKLGEGGFGVVYRAVHPLIGKHVAIKVLGRMFSVNPEMVSRFIAEARAVNQIRHRNIIDIFSFGQLADGRQYYVMELLSGMTLDAYLAACGGRLAPEAALPLLRAVARALDAAHAKGIAHRDLKPENIFIADDDGVPFPKLLDFGIAKLLGGDQPHLHKTRTGAPIGTPTYMSPEQCRGKDVDHRTDIYSFGIMTYQLLTGLLPFRSDDIVELLVQQTRGTAEAPSRACAELPPALDAPMLHMMEKDPARRPETVTVALDAMYRALGMATPSAAFPTPLRGATAPHRLPSTGAFTAGEATRTAAGPRRMRGMRFGAIALTVVVAAAAGVAVIASRPAAPPDAHAPPPAPPSVAVATPAPTPATAPAPPRPAPAPPPAVEPARTVAITIVDAPAGTQVYGRDAALLGTLPGTLELARGDAPLEIRLEHAGFAPRTEKIAVTAATTLSLPLRKLSRPKPIGGKKPPGEIPDF